MVAFQPCATTTKAQQQWSFNDNANFEGTADGSTLDGFCFNAQSPNVSGSFVILAARSAGKCYGAYDNVQTFSPDAAVGAGAAGTVAAAAWTSPARTSTPRSSSRGRASRRRT